MPGKKINHNKNFAARQEWMKKKKVGRPKQLWVTQPSLQGKYIPVRYREFLDSGQIP